MTTITENLIPLEVVTGYKPHMLQAYVHRRMKRFNVLVCHRRFGKTVLAINALIDSCLRNTKVNPRYGYACPFRQQAKEVVWGYLKQYCQSIPGAKFNESELRVDFPNGGRITLYGADNPDAMRGRYFDGFVADEVAQMKRSVWGEIIRPALADRRGWILFIGTPKGINLFHELFHKNIGRKNWYVDSFPIGRTLEYLPWLDTAEIAESREAVSEAQARQEWDCDWSASSDDTLITIDIVGKARGKHISEDSYSLAPKVLSVDVARFGDDRSCILLRQGLACFEPIIIRKIDNMTLADRVMAEIDKHNPDAVFIDAGRGEGVIDRCRQCGYDVIEVHFGGEARDPKHFKNKRMEMWQDAKTWLEQGGALPDNPELIADLVVPTYDYEEATGKKRLETKKAMKKRVGRSPDVGDAFALSFAHPVKNRKFRNRMERSRNGVQVGRVLSKTNDDYDVHAQAA